MNYLEVLFWMVVMGSPAAYMFFQHRGANKRWDRIQALRRSMLVLFEYGGDITKDVEATHKALSIFPDFQSFVDEAALPWGRTLSEAELGLLADYFDFDPKVDPHSHNNTQRLGVDAYGPWEGFGGQVTRSGPDMDLVPDALAAYEARSAQTQANKALASKVEVATLISTVPSLALVREQILGSEHIDLETKARWRRLIDPATLEAP